MAYDPTTGEWKDEDTSVSNRLTGLLSKDSPLMRQAETRGLQQANRRGLANSTMAVGAVENERLNVALPIASQESSQANSRHMLGRQLQSADVTQRRGIESQERMQGIDIAQRTAEQTRDISSREGMQLRDIASREGMQAADLAQMNEAQLRDIASREGMQAADLAAMVERQNAQFGQEQWLSQFDANTRERLQQLDANTRLTMQQLDIDSQQRISSMNLANNELAQVANLALSFESIYSGMLETIMNNPDIPAESRQAYMDQAARIRESNLALMEQLYGFEIEWAA